MFQFQVRARLVSGGNALDRLGDEARCLKVISVSFRRCVGCRLCEQWCSYRSRCGLQGYKMSLRENHNFLIYNPGPSPSGGGLRQ